MSTHRLDFDKTLIENALDWFQPEFRRNLVSVIESQFANYRLPNEILSILENSDTIRQGVQRLSGETITPTLVEAKFFRELGSTSLKSLLKEIILLYRRFRAGHAERLTERTVHLQLARAIEKDVRILDDIVSQDWFQAIEPIHLPRLQDFMPIQFMDNSPASQLVLPQRQYDEKFHILQAPSLFLPDLAYFRAKCDERESPLSIAFLDIDDFKKLNTRYSESKVDRNVLPRFMQAIESHMFHHGYAYRQGGDEYLILVPSFSREMAVEFVNELRQKLEKLRYVEVEEKTTVSIGLCIVESDCPLTDREIREKANHAKDFAKKNGKNRIATYTGPRFIEEVLQIVKP